MRLIIFFILIPVKKETLVNIFYQIVLIKPVTLGGSKI